MAESENQTVSDRFSLRDFIGFSFEKVESDLELDDSDARSNATTDEEFYNELMSVPGQEETHLSKKSSEENIHQRSS